MSRKPNVCLSIAGLDPSGGAGVIADIKTFAAFGCYGAAAVTSITFQNTTGVFGTLHQTSESVRMQVQPIVDDLSVDALKTGMLPTAEIIEATAELISNNGLKNIVVDPVVRSTSGFDLIDGDALRALVEKLFPLSDIVTPNLAEAERITGIAIESEADVEDAAGVMRSMGARSVLIKGGHHFEGAKKGVARDTLFMADSMRVFESEFIETSSTHGTGCTLSAAIAANLAMGIDLPEAVENAKKYVTEAIRNAPDIGRGHSPIDHLVKNW
jgi:hydroxymethylpyrimidine kinase/phosphomethylpyrimidine kinase